MRRKLILVFTILLFVLVVTEIFLIKSASNFELKTFVVYSKIKIPEKTTIDASMLQIREVNISGSHKLSFSKVDDILGKIAKVDIEEDEMLLNTKFGKKDEMAEIPLLDKNNRLFSYELKPDQANGWWLLIGQLVDIIFVPIEKPSQIQQSQLVQPIIQTTTPLPNVPNIPSKLERIKSIRIAALLDEKGQLLNNTKRDTLPRYISFEVSANQAEFLAYAKSNGRIELSIIPLIMK